MDSKASKVIITTIISILIITIIILSFVIYSILLDQKKYLMIDTRGANVITASIGLKGKDDVSYMYIRNEEPAPIGTAFLPGIKIMTYGLSELPEQSGDVIYPPYTY